MLTIEVILYDGFDELDALGPYEVLRTAQENGADIHAELVGAHGAATITASHGARFIVDRGPSGASDMVVVPGGGWNTRDGTGAWGEPTSATERMGPLQFSSLLGGHERLCHLIVRRAGLV